MSKLYKPRLRSFEKASNQRHITDKDRFLYKKQDHESKYRINIIGAGTMGMEHMYVATLLGEAQIYGIYDQEIHSLDIAEKELSEMGEIAEEWIIKKMTKRMEQEKKEEWISIEDLERKII